MTSSPSDEERHLNAIIAELAESADPNQFIHHAPHHIDNIQIGSPSTLSVSPLPSSPTSPSPASYSASEVLSIARSTPVWKENASISNLSDSAFGVRRLTGGSTNCLWLVSIHPPLPDDLHNSTEIPVALVVRFYGASADAFIHRSSEALLADLLSQSNIGARIYHHFEGANPGRIESFIAGRTLDHKELMDERIGLPVMREMAQLHGMTIPETKEYESISRHPQLFRSMWRWMLLAMRAAHDAGIDAKEDSLSSDSSSTPADDIYSRTSQRRVFASFRFPSHELISSKRMDELLATDLSDSKDFPPELKQSEWVKEINWLQALLDNWTKPQSQSSNPSSSPSSFVDQTMSYSNISLCHNDLNPGNILYNDPSHTSSSDSLESKLADSQSSVNPFTLIDFEYAAHNSPAYDLANHFIEYALDYTLSDWPLFQFKQDEFFLTQEKMIQRIKTYMEEKKKKNSTLPPVTSATLGHLYVSTLTHILASHMIWSVWSIIQASTAPVIKEEDQPSWKEREDGQHFQPSPLAYIEYAEQRIEMYHQMKKIWLKYSTINKNGSSSSSSSSSSSPPDWPTLTSDADWSNWLEQLEPAHREIQHIQLDSKERQQKALQTYQKRTKEAKKTSVKK